MDRKRHTWKVTLHDNQGTTQEVEIKNYWDPAREETKEAIGQAAAIEAHMKSGKRIGYSPTKVQLVS